MELTSRDSSPATSASGLAPGPWPPTPEGSQRLSLSSTSASCGSGAAGGAAGRQGGVRGASGGWGERRTRSPGGGLAAQAVRLLPQCGVFQAGRRGGAGRAWGAEAGLRQPRLRRVAHSLRGWRSWWWRAPAAWRRCRCWWRRWPGPGTLRQQGAQARRSGGGQGGHAGRGAQGGGSCMGAEHAQPRPAGRRRLAQSRRRGSGRAWPRCPTQGRAPPPPPPPSKPPRPLPHPTLTPPSHPPPAPRPCAHLARAACTM
jgi:hypothetical protein